MIRRCPTSSSIRLNPSASVGSRTPDRRCSSDITARARVAGSSVQDPRPDPAIAAIKRANAENALAGMGMESFGSLVWGLGLYNESANTLTAWGIGEGHYGLVSELGF